MHWSHVGDSRATDAEIMGWAAANGRVVVTCDLDFGAILAATNAQGPSVVQLRAQNVLPTYFAKFLIPVLRNCESQLASGALVVVDEAKSRVRILPLRTP